METPHQSPARSAIVTGAAQGLGFAIAQRFAAEGGNVLLVDRDPKVLSLIGQNGLPTPQCIALQQDLASPEAARVVFAAAVEKFGHVDTLINNAAWCLYKPFRETTLDEFDLSVAINQRAPYLLAQEFSRHIEQSQGAVKNPSIVNISSVNAQAGNANLVAYAGTKGALEAMTRAMAVELAPLGVRVNSVGIGAIDTPTARKFVEDGVFESDKRFDKFLVKRFATSQEVAELVWFLCSPACGCVTGANWAIDGGYLAQ
jgi:NAD(P)-dependent dehydrogenase (short-subunit alcohol dehydrogenase family)